MNRPEAVMATGWYRVTPGGWQPVSDEEAAAIEAEGGGWDLVHVTVDAEEIALW